MLLFCVLNKWCHSDRSEAKWRNPLSITACTRRNPQKSLTPLITLNQEERTEARLTAGLFPFNPEQGGPRKVVHPHPSCFEDFAQNPRG